MFDPSNLLHCFVQLRKALLNPFASLNSFDLLNSFDPLKQALLNCWSLGNASRVDNEGSNKFVQNHSPVQNHFFRTQSFFKIEDWKGLPKIEDCVHQIRD